MNISLWKIHRVNCTGEKKIEWNQINKCALYARVYEWISRFISIWSKCFGCVCGLVFCILQLCICIDVMIILSHDRMHGVCVCLCVCHRYVAMCRKRYEFEVFATWLIDCSKNRGRQQRQLCFNWVEGVSLRRAVPFDLLQVIRLKSDKRWHFLTNLQRNLFKEEKRRDRK